MLQSRLENEHYNSLPVLMANDRAHTGFISTDRPDSSHVFQYTLNFHLVRYFLLRIVGRFTRFHCAEKCLERESKIGTK